MNIYQYFCYLVWRAGFVLLHTIMSPDESEMLGKLFIHEIMRKSVFSFKLNFHVVEVFLLLDFHSTLRGYLRMKIQKLSLQELLPKKPKAGCGGGGYFKKPSGASRKALKQEPTKSVWLKLIMMRNVTIIIINDTESLQEQVFASSRLFYAPPLKFN